MSEILIVYVAMETTKTSFLPVNQNLSSMNFSLAKFQLVSCNFSLAMIWQITYSQTAKTVFSHLKVLISTYKFSSLISTGTDTECVGGERRKKGEKTNALSRALL